MLKSVFAMLRDVEEGALIRVNCAQVMRDANVQGSFKAQKMMDISNTTIVAQYGITNRGRAYGACHTVESDCLVEVLLEDAA